MAIRETDRLMRGRQLALEIRPRRFAFAVLDGGELLDWGVRYYPSGASRLETALARLAFVLKLYGPSIAVARRPRHAGDESSKYGLCVFAAIRRELKRRSISCVVVNRRDVRERFARQGFHTKYEIARVLAERFSQLKNLLPRPRRAWERERHVMAIFDAIAAAIVFNARLTPDTEDHL